MEEKNKKAENKDTLISKIKDDAKNYIKKNPKNVFIGMIVLTAISLISNVFYYNYVVKNAKTSYSNMNEQLFNKNSKSIDISNNNSISKQATDFFEMKNDLDKLKEFQNKKNLTKEDTLEIQRIVKKYNLK